MGAGADHVIVTEEVDLAENAMAITSGKGVSLVFDPVAGPLLEKLAELLLLVRVSLNTVRYRRRQPPSLCSQR